MPEIKAEMIRVQWLLDNGVIGPDEPAKLILPRIDAKERIRNERKIRRITINTDEHGVSQFAAIKEAWMGELDNNPSLFFSAVIQALGTFDIRGWKETNDSP